jgi:sRNA-binding protein
MSSGGEIGIHNDILAALDGAVTPADLSRALGICSGNKVYRSRLRIGAVRVGLDGELADAETIRRAQCRDSQGSSLGPLAEALDRIREHRADQ